MGYFKMTCRMCRSYLLAMLLTQSVIGTLTRKHFLIETKDKVKDIGKENDYLSPNTTGSGVHSSTAVTAAMTTTPFPIEKDIGKENDSLSPKTTGTLAQGSRVNSSTAVTAAMITTPFPIGKCRGDKSCCTSSNPCGEGEGDCDKNHDCKGKLLCGINNCKRSKYPTFSKSDDCCYDPAKECGTEPACTGGAACLRVDKKKTCVCKKRHRYIGGQCIGGPGPIFIDQSIDQCITKHRGPWRGVNKPCEKLWIYKGKTYNQCALAGHHRPWCATKTDGSGKYMKGFWGFCPKTCHVDDLH